MAQIIIQNLSFTYEGDHTPVFQGLDLRLDTNWKLGLVGRNGRGKTTLLRLLAGELEGTGTIRCPEPASYFPIPVSRPDRPVLQVLLEENLGLEEWQLVRELNRLGLDEALLERPFSTLSGGEQTRAQLAALFASEGCYPMVDEPTNHLDGPGRDQVARYLRSLDRGFLLVSHDRAFLDGCVDHILALNPSGPELVRGDFSTWFREKEARDRGEQARNEKLKGEVRRLEEAARARKQKADAVERAKTGISSQGIVKHGLRPYLGEKSRKGQQQRLNIERRAERAIREKSALLRDVETADSLKLTPARHYSQRLAEGKELSIFYENRVICKDITFTIEQGERVCLEGPNGSGKTSLLRLVLGEEVPQSGTLRLAPGLDLSYVPQKADHLTGSLLDWADEQGIDLTQFLTVLRKLDFSRALFDRDMEGYSAGQKKKVLLAAGLCRSAHLYVWDEPLNYIDLFSRMQIEELILEHRPTLLFVEHDQVFREKIATKYIALP
ncbi:ribosomal protection-like ABC-F family protein [Pseudoflavonifractor phocaeensis]|uniref:ribosomal protection-like ABC-F family protein n=1 Tax=Pseudoflavonifractor phocaeensis TaxID=1870988 RepID=UPI001F23B0B4|nr:ATP-binding cassette domain-containing protein [Pseudoflavonifractor phocaeensis]MCF2662275.1 ABC-F family ATP-binding cassette domain-containing protein [Pseudoflavonifractor phocaeensis]